MILIILLFVGVFVFTALYFLQFHVDLDGKKEKIIKDGLIKELMNAAVADPDPNSLIINVDAQTITMGEIVVKKPWDSVFWFPYKVVREGNKYRWDDSIVGHITRYSKDYYTVRDLLKKSKTNIEQTQREKLNLNK